jgi:hypothetical protein
MCENGGFRFFGCDTVEVLSRYIHFNACNVSDFCGSKVSLPREDHSVSEVAHCITVADGIGV